MQLAHAIVIDISLFFVKNIKRRHLISLSYSFSCGFSILVELELVEMLVFVEGGKPENREKNPRSKTRAVEN